MDKRGAGEVLMLFPFLFLALILLGGVIWGVYAYFGQGYDIREKEAQLLAEKSVKCFIKNGEKSAEEFASVCKFDYDVVSDNHLIYIEKSENNLGVVQIGVTDYKNQCSFEAGKKNRNYPKCVNGTFEKQGEKYNYIVGSNQKVRRVA